MASSDSNSRQRKGSEISFICYAAGVTRRRYRSAALAAAAVVALTAAGLFSLPRLRRLTPPIVAVIPETTAQEIWESEHAGISRATLGTDWRVYWNGPPNEDQVAKQIVLVRHAIEMHARGLILAPDHPLALMTAVRNATAAGIPTVILATDLALEPDKNLAFVLNDDAAAGSMAADAVAKLLHEKGEVAVLGENPDLTSAAARGQSFAKAIETRYPGVRIVARPRGSFRLGEAEQETEDLLHRYPNLRAIISIGITETRGAQIALGGFSAKRKILLVGFDQDLDLMFAVRKGAIKAVIAQNTFAMGVQAMQMLEAKQKGVPMTPVTRVRPVLVTRETIDRPDVQQVLSMDWRPQRP